MLWDALKIPWGAKRNLRTLHAFMLVFAPVNYLTLVSPYCKLGLKTVAARIKSVKILKSSEQCSSIVIIVNTC